MATDEVETVKRLFVAAAIAAVATELLANASVPAPQSWALTIVGLAGLGATIRASRRLQFVPVRA